LNAGHEVVGLDKNPKNPQAQKTLCITGNILDKDVVFKAMDGSDVVIHLAAEHQDWGISKETYFEVNQIGTRNLLDCATKVGCRKFVFFSSVAVYGTQGEPTTEDTAPNPDNDYGRSKWAAENEVRAWYEADRSQCAIIIRPTVVYGPWMNDYSNVFRLLDQIHKRRFFFVGGMKNVKSLAYVENMVGATHFLINKLDSGFEVFNYAEQQHSAIKEIAMRIADNMNKPIPNLSLPYQPALLLAGGLDILAKKTKINIPITAERIKKVNTATHHTSEKIIRFGYEPEYTNDEGLKKSCAWFLGR
jgi:nucleoside-diphosphate-sugar epimerase